MKFKRNFKYYLFASTILAGTILGAGIFSLPYVFSQAGFLLGFFFLIFTCFLTTLTHLLYGESLLRTEKECRFPGLAKIYLGKFGFYLVSATSFISLVGVLLAYLILGGEFSRNFSQIIHRPLGFSQGVLIFWLIGSLGIISGIRLISWGETFGLFLMLILIFLFFFLGLPRLDLFSLGEINLKHLLLPYGVLLFALSGGSAVPEIFNYFKKNQISPQEINFKKPIIYGSILPAFLYLFFVLGVFGILGEEISSVDIVPDLIKISPSLGIIIDLLGLILILTSYFIVGLGIRNIMFFDWKINNFLSWFSPIFLPLIFYFLGITNFLRIISFLGAGILGVESVLNLFIHWIAQKKGQLPPPFQIRIPFGFRLILMAFFILGAGLEIAKFF